jgi:hypothetical protein
MFVRIGWMMRGIFLGAKLDECSQCHEVGPHLLVRKTHWFTVWGLPLVLLWISHSILCPACGDAKPLSFRAMWRGLRNGRLQLDRERPHLREALAGEAEAASPDDWRALGVEPGANAEAVQASYRRQAKQTHPDLGGSDHAFAALSSAYQRVLATLHGHHGAASDAEVAAVVEPVVPNPNRGGWDLYLKAWPVMAAIALAILIANSSPSVSNGSTTGGSYSGGYSNTSGQAHTCWVSGNTIVGCIDPSGRLAGSNDGIQETCYFVWADKSSEGRCYP